MRYLDWDVLLFPDDSKIPIQEFKTGCFITADPDSMTLQTTNYHQPSFPPTHNTNTRNDTPPSSPPPRPLPTVTSFVPALPQGTPFRVSLHSWQQPVASRAALAVVQNSGAGDVVFEARVCLDGVCVAGILFGLRPGWPQQIEVDKAGNHDPLRFPPFHQAMLTQSFWNAGENLGRIRVIIAEGILNGAGTSPPFTRIGNIVSFSFQHAPLNILEDAGIAWPNPAMWYQLPQGFCALPSPHKAGTDPDAHAHSPRRHDGSKGPSRTSSVMQPQPPAMDPPGTQESHWVPLAELADPFVEKSKPVYRKLDPKRFSSASMGDQSMRDYSNSITSTSSRYLSNYNETSIPLPEDTESQFDELMAAYSPQKEMAGIHAPANTRNSSATNTPPKPLRPSAAAEARAVSYSHLNARSVSVTTRDPQQPSQQFRESSDGSMQSCFSTQLNEHPVKTKPAAEIKSRKEGRSGEDGVPAEHKHKNSWLRQIKDEDKAKAKCGASSDGKRKRSLNIPGADLMVENVPSSSPERKVSRVEGMGEGMGQGGRSGRSVLGEMENVG